MPWDDIGFDATTVSLNSLAFSYLIAFRQSKVGSHILRFRHVRKSPGKSHLVGTLPLNHHPHIWVEWHFHIAEKIDRLDVLLSQGVRTPGTDPK
jgi:hypothetical protein